MSVQRKFYILIIAMSITLYGCGQSPSKPVPQQMSEQSGQQEKVPDQLKGIEDGIEKIFKTLNGPSQTTKEGQKGQGGQSSSSSGGQPSPSGQGGQPSPSSQGGQPSPSGQGGQSSSGEQGSQPSPSGQGSQQGQQGQGQQPSPSPKDPWKEITTDVDTLHFQWNGLMPLALKAGANKTLLDNFSNALNGLTGTILTKNSKNTMLAANNLYAYIPDFYNLYKAKTSPEIKRIRHFVRSAIIHSMVGDWTKADSEIADLKSSWSLFKSIISKDQQEDASRFDLSITEFAKVIAQRSETLTNIKGRIALSNIESLEKKMSEGSSK